VKSVCLILVQLSWNLLQNTERSRYRTFLRFYWGCTTAHDWTTRKRRFKPCEPQL